MGYDIYGGPNNELHTSRAARLVINWLMEFDTRDRSDWTPGDWADDSGNVDYPSDCVRIADACVLRSSFINLEKLSRSFKIEGLSRKDVDEARAFIANAAARGAGVSGSF